VKGELTAPHSAGAVAGETPSDAAEIRPHDVRRVYKAHAQFVWSSLQRLGIRETDLDDLLQEVFVVVHLRLHTFQGNSSITTWLFGICMRVAANHRRRAHIRHEDIVADVPEGPTLPDSGPESAAVRRQDLAELEAVLDAMDLEKRAIFVMFEVEEMPCAEIATMLGIPVGTVYSRLHAARKQFESIVSARDRARQQQGVR
jgi:RNA polymerase sigma-70 factor (ECF subfamily)